MEQKMFCYQCQETAGCKGCTMSGVCGKKPDVAAMQDLLVYVTKGISAVTTALRQEGKQVSAEINHLYWSSFLVTLCSEIMLYIETPLVSYSYSLNEVSHSCTS